MENFFLVGFYTISMGLIEFSNLPIDNQIGLPKYPIPIAKIGRLAVDQKVSGRGFGKLLLIDALYRTNEALKVVAAYGVIVDAKDEQAASFYKHFGFIECMDNQLSLFLLQKTIKVLFS